MLGRRASLSIEVLVSCFIFSVCSLLLVHAFMLLKVNHSSNYPFQLDHGIFQLQELVALSEIVEVTPFRVVLLYHNETVELSQRNQRLLRTPGTVIYLDQIDHTQFQMEDQLLYLSFEWGGEEYSYVIGKKEWWRD